MFRTEGIGADQVRQGFTLRLHRDVRYTVGGRVPPTLTHIHSVLIDNQSWQSTVQKPVEYDKSHSLGFHLSSVRFVYTFKNFFPVDPFKSQFLSIPLKGQNKKTEYIESQSRLLRSLNLYATYNWFFGVGVGRERSVSWSFPRRVILLCFTSVIYEIISVCGVLFWHRGGCVYRHLKLTPWIWRWEWSNITSCDWTDGPTPVSSGSPLDPDSKDDLLLFGGEKTVTIPYVTPLGPKVGGGRSSFIPLEGEDRSLHRHLRIFSPSRRLGWVVTLFEEGGIHRSPPGLPLGLKMSVDGSHFFLVKKGRLHHSLIWRFCLPNLYFIQE